LSVESLSIVNTLHLVSHQSWQRDELAKADGWQVDLSYGLDVPAYAPGDAWWLPQAQAVQLLRAIDHYQLPEVVFIAPTPDLLDQLPESLTGRHVETMTVNDALSTLFGWPPLWWKLATAKHDGFVAQLRTHDELVAAIEELALPGEAWLQNSTPLPEIISEYRFFVSKQRSQLKIQTGSGYLRHGVTVYDGAEFPEDEYELAEEKVLELLDTDMTLPPAFVVDVAVTVDGVFILEFNPAWCSGWYDCEVEKFLPVILKSVTPSSRDKKLWAYKPDRVLLDQYGNEQRRLWGAPVDKQDESVVE